MKHFTNIVRAKRVPAETAAALGLSEIKGENRLEVRNESGKPAEIFLLGSIGKSWWDDSGISEQEVRDALSVISRGTPVTVHINSEGGSVKEGLGIYNAFKDRKDDVTCRVAGYALSIASVLPLGAGKVISPKSAIWMTHKAWSWASGNSDDMQRQVDMLKEHDETLAEIYAAETGKTAEEWKQLMQAETWIRGSKAVEFGLADEGDDEQGDAQAASFPPIHSQYLGRCKNAPAEILNAINARTAQALQQLSAPPSGAARNEPNPTAPNTEAGTDTNIMNKAQMLALLNKWGVKVPDNSSDAEILALVEAGKPATTTTSTAPAQAAATTADNSTVIAQLAADNARILAQLEREKKVRMERDLDQLVVENRLTLDERPAALARALKDETYLSELQARPVASFGGTGVGPSVAILAENPLEKIFAEKDAGKRHAAALADWEGILNDAMARDSRGDKCRVKSPHSKHSAGSGLPVAANTYSATLVTSFLLDGSVTILQNVLAGIGTLARGYDSDRYKPLATAVLKKVTAGSATQTNATNFESGDSTVAPVSVTMNQYTQSFQVSNSDLNSGLRMQDLVDVNAAAFGNKLMQVVTAPITEANFANYNGGSYVGTPALFTWGQMALIWGALKKAGFKNAVLDGEYIGQLNNQPSFFQGTGIGGTEAMKFGWNKIELNTEWSGAGTGVRGFACHPQAITVVNGLPLTPTAAGNQIPGATLMEGTVTIPTLGITIANYTWFSLASRTFWASYDLMLGAKETDTTAGIIIKAQ